MILLVLVGVLWIVVLLPSAYRRLSERQSVGSIEHFHRELNLLEHAGPKLVTPAYRLQTAATGGEVAGHGEVGSPEGPSMYRAKLVLVRPVDDEQAADIDDGDGTHYERVGVLDPPLEPQISHQQTRVELQAYRRQEARRRCATVLRLLIVITISTALLGILPSLRLAWIFTAVTGALLLGLVGLIAYAREMEAERRRRPAPFRATDHGPLDQSPGAAQSGLPGAWDAEEDLPRQAAAGR